MGVAAVDWEVSVGQGATWPVERVAIPMLTARKPHVNVNLVG